MLLETLRLKQGVGGVRPGGVGGIGVDSCAAVEEVIQVLPGCIGQGETCRLSALTPLPPPSPTATITLHRFTYRLQKQQA